MRTQQPAAVAAAAAAAEQASSAARDPCLVALCRVRKCRDQGQGPASPSPCLCACLPLSARCLPKEEWPNLSLHLIKMQGRRQTASSLLIREAGLRGSRPERADPRKAFQVRKAPAAVHMPNAASPSWPSLRPSVPMAQQSREPTGPFCPSTKDAKLAGGQASEKPERGDPDLIALLIFFRGRSTDGKGLAAGHLRPNPEPLPRQTHPGKALT